MYTSKSLLLPLAATVVAALAAPSPTNPVLAPRASSTSTTGTAFFFSQTEYGGNSAVYYATDGETPFCLRFSGPGDIGANFNTVASYDTSDVACYTFASDDCSGESNGSLSGDNATANIAVGSLYCIYGSD